MLITSVKSGTARHITAQIAIIVDLMSTRGHPNSVMEGLMEKRGEIPRKRGRQWKVCPLPLRRTFDILNMRV